VEAETSKKFHKERILRKRDERVAKPKKSRTTPIHVVGKPRNKYNVSNDALSKFKD
jgi:hypothetical protein